MDVVLLHTKYDSSNISRPYLNKGTFGAILALTGVEAGSVAKRMTFKKAVNKTLPSESMPKPEQIEEVLLEYAFYRVCSALGIGPKVRIHPAFDIVCFGNCLQFSMERC